MEYGQYIMGISMRNGKLFIYLLTVFFCAAAVLLGIIDLEWEPFPFSVRISSEGESVEIDCWKDNNGDFYIFLPGHAELSQMTLHVNSFHKVYLSGCELSEGMTCDQFQMNVPYELTYRDAGREYCYTATFLQSANVSTMFLDVQSGSMEHIHEEKGNEEPGTIRLYTADGSLNYAGYLESVKGRGNATWADDKKAYSLKLVEEADLLGMGQAQKWVLLANAYDPSHMKNKIAYDLAEGVGLTYSPQCEWVDLYLNGEYAGLYLLSERNEVHPQRVAIPEDGGFLVSLEPQYRLADQGYPFISTESGVALRVHQSAMTTEGLAELWQSVENAILSADGTDSNTGKSWQDWIDVDSWAKKYLLEELLGNCDAITASQYFYYDGADPSGKIFAGPVWDLDDSMGNGNWGSTDPRSLLVNRPHLYNSSDKPWFHALYEKALFYDRTIEIYQTSFRPLLQELLDNGLEQDSLQIAQAAAANAVRWNLSDTATAVESIRSYLQARIEFFDDFWLGSTPYCIVQIDADDGSWACFAIRQGDNLPVLPEFENTENVRYQGWYTVDTNEPFDITQPILEDASIYRKQDMLG